MPHTARRPSLLQEAAAAEYASHAAIHVESSDTMRSWKGQCQAPPDNVEIRDTYHSSREINCAGEKIEQHQTYTSGTAAAGVRMYTSEADFHKPGIYGGSVRVWANPWDVFHRTPSRGGRGRRAAVGLFRGVFWVGRDFFVFFFRFLYFERTRPTASMRAPCLMYLSTSNEARTRERSNRSRFLP